MANKKGIFELKVKFDDTPIVDIKLNRITDLKKLFRNLEDKFE